MKVFKLVALTAIIIVMSVVASMAQDTPVEINETGWILRAFSLDDVWVEVTPNTEITIQFTDGLFSASAGCNSIFGEYTLEGDAFSIQTAGISLMICEEDIMNQETSFVDSLEAAIRVSQEDSSLIIHHGENVSLVFDRYQMIDLGGLEPEITIDEGGLFTSDAIVSGTVVIRDESSLTVLPIGTQITVQLVDISLADAPSILSETTFGNFDSLPISFSLGVNSSDIDENGSYSVSASIYDANENLLYTSDTVHPVLTQDAGTSTDIELIEVASMDDPDAMLSIDVEGTVWIFRAFALDDIWVEAFPNADFTLTFADGMVTGLAGCASYTGTYSLDEGNSLSISDLTVLDTDESDCQDDLVHQGETYIEALSSADLIVSEGESLIVYYTDNDNVYLVFDIPQIQN